MQESRSHIFMIHAEQALLRYSGIPAAAFVHAEEKHAIVMITGATVKALRLVGAIIRVIGYIGGERVTGLQNDPIRISGGE